jgi:hypothetical protein
MGRAYDKVSTSRYKAVKTTVLLCLSTLPILSFLSPRAIGQCTGPLTASSIVGTWTGTMTGGGLTVNATWYIYASTNGFVAYFCWGPFPNGFSGCGNNPTFVGGQLNGSALTFPYSGPNFNVTPLTGSLSSLTGTFSNPTSYQIQLAKANCQAALAITTSSLPNGTVGSAYPSTTLTATGGTRPYTWAVSGLPAGLVVDSNTGIIGGTPAQAGNSLPVTVTVTDSAGSSTSVQLSITVKPSVLQITTNSLPAGVWQTSASVFSQYAAPLMVAGGTPPYTLNVTGLPNSLTVDASSGAISGSFTEDSENISSFDRIKRQFAISVSVTDSVGATAGPVALTIDFTCGSLGDADSLIGQYTTSNPLGTIGVPDAVTGRPFAPRCMDITRSAHSQSYLFSALNSSNLSQPTVALLANSLLAGQGVAYFLPPPLFHGPGLDAWVGNFGSVPPLNGPANQGSGFRPPKDQVRVYNGTQPIPTGGRHMFGDAVDLPVTPAGTAGTPAMWKQLVDAAINAGADYTESTSADANRSCGKSKRLCVHADWRFATSLLGGSAPYAQ